MHHPGRDQGLSATNEPRPEPVRPVGPNIVHLIGPLVVTDGFGGSLGAIGPGRATLVVQRIAAAGGDVVSVDALIEVLWPDGAPTTADRTVASLISRVRSATDASMIGGTARSGYRFNVGPEWTSDLAIIGQLAREAQRRAVSAPSLAASAASRALDLLGRGRLLDGGPAQDQEWVEELDRNLEATRDRLQRSLWTAQTELGLWDEIVGGATAALAVAPHDEHAARALMVAHWRQGDRGSALGAFDRLREVLRGELGVEPSPDTYAIQSSIVRGDLLPSSTSPLVDDIPEPVRLAGRDDEFWALLQEWVDAAAGGARSVVIRGARGSGRTQLIRALAAVVERTGGRMLESRSFEGERSAFLQPLLTVTRQALLSTPAADLPALLGPWEGTAVDLIPELDLVLDLPAYQRASPDLEHRRALQTLAHVLRQLSDRQPLLLAFDDLHHAGRSTLDALQWLVHELEPSPILFLTSVQNDELDPDLDRLVALSTAIDLGPISRRSVGVMATDAGLHDGDAQFIWDLTHGHLLFVVEVIAARQRGESRSQVPASLQKLVLGTIGAWPRGEREALEAASVIGTSFDLPTLEALTDRPAHELLPHLTAAMAGGYLETSNDQFVFVNEAIRDALYNSLLGPLRRRHHLRLAELLVDQPERRAGHLRAAGQTEAAALAWLASAKLARQMFANADAVRLSSEAITAAEESDNLAILGEALICRGTARQELGDYQGATEDDARAEALWLRTGDRSLRVHAAERMGWTAYYRRDHVDATRRAEQMVQMPGAHPSAWALLGRIRHWAGDLTGASDAYARALAELDDDSAIRASVLSCLGALLAHSDRYPEAIDVLDDAVELSNDIGAFRPLLRTLFFEGLARANSGDLDGARTTLETKAELLRRYDVTFYRARTNTCLAWVWRELGQNDRAGDLSQLALEQSREVDEQDLQIEQELHARCSLADCDLVRGDVDSAVQHIAEAQRLIDNWLPFRWRAELRILELAVRVGLQDAEALLVAARERSSPKYTSLAFHLLGRPGEAAEAARATGSVLLLGEVAPGPDGRAARDELLRRLPSSLRDQCARRGRLFLPRP